MAEPTSSAGATLAVLTVALLGPLAGPYTLIVMSALAGALWPMGDATTASRKAGAWLLLRCTLTAVALTGVISLLIQKHWSVPAIEVLSPVAFIIGALGNGWKPVFEAIGAAISAVVGRVGAKQEPKP